MRIITNGIASSPVPIQILAIDMAIIINTNTFSKGQVQSLEANNDGNAVINPALYVVAEGYTSGDLQLTNSNLDNPPIFPKFPDNIAGAPGITITFSGPVMPEDPSLPASQPQRFTFPYQISFVGLNMFSGWPNNASTLNVSIV
jgi:hypothetical protein